MSRSKKTRRPFPLRRWRRCPSHACDYCCPKTKRLKQERHELKDLYNFPLDTSKKTH